MAERLSVVYTTLILQRISFYWLRFIFKVLRPSTWLIIRALFIIISKKEEMCFKKCEDFYEVEVKADYIECDVICTPLVTNYWCQNRFDMLWLNFREENELVDHWRGDENHRDKINANLTVKSSIFSGELTVLKTTEYKFRSIKVSEADFFTFCKLGQNKFCFTFFDR